MSLKSLNQASPLTEKVTVYAKSVHHMLENEIKGKGYHHLKLGWCD